MSREIEDRLRRALDARADQVTSESLRAADQEPLSAAGESRPRDRTKTAWVWGSVASGVAAAVAAVVVGVAMNDDSVPQPAGPSRTALEPRPTTVTGSDCVQEAMLIDRALDTSSTRADVDGDGADDVVAIAVDDQAGPGCRAFVGVRTVAGTTYSTALDGTTAAPGGLVPEVVALPDLGADGDSEVVVDTHVRADGQLARLFSLSDEGLRWVPSPAFEDGTFYVEGGGVANPRGADCTTDGAFVLSMATAVNRGSDYEVTRHVYPAAGDPLKLGDPQIESRTVAASVLTQEFPEFGHNHFAACS